MGRRWNRKRKADQNGNKKNGNERKDYSPILQSNPRMEAYYALQGLHSHCYKDGDLKACTPKEEYERERQLWLSTMRTILPASFRIGTYVDESLRERLELELETHVGTEMELEVEVQDRHYKIPTDEKGSEKDKEEKDQATPTTVVKRIAPAQKIPFVPHAYQLSVDRRTIRRNAALNQFHDWLKVQTTAGFVTRQETVSMIPPVVLDVQPHHLVLDMCAAPGSKTSQLLEQVSTFDGLEPRGCVVANDADPKRAYMLVHQLRRINSPAVFCTSCDAQFFPLLKSKQETERGLEGMFDRVLCDVPCSGDGTARKNPGIWKNWNQLGALSLHPLQIAITLNGARLTKVGGYICYSTCSMNPIENEAVVAELLRLTDGSLTLVDKRSDMPGLMARPGWTSWKVLTEKGSRKQIKNFKKKHNAKMKARRAAWEEKQKQQEEKEKLEKEEEPPNKVLKEDGEGQDAGNSAGEIGEEDGLTKDDKPMETDKVAVKDYGHGDLGPPPSWDEETLLERAKSVGFVEYKTFDDVPEESRRRIRASCFPPTAEEVASLELHKCMRCLPQDMDTGGFFVALFQKVAPLGSKAKDRAATLAKELRSDAVDKDGTAAPVDAKNNKGKNEPASETPTEKEDAVMKDVNEDEVESTSNVSSKEDDIANTADESTKESSGKEDEKQEQSQNKNKIVKGKPLLRGRSKTRGDLGNENFLPLSDDIWARHVEFYGFAPTFPRSQFMKRASGEAKVLSFIGQAIKTQFIDCGIQDRVTVINSGLKAFERNNKDCDVTYRVAQEGIHYVVPHMTKRKIICSFQDYSNCLAPGAIRLETFSSDFADAVRPLEVGSFVVALQGYESNIFKKMFMVMWRCRGDAINCLVSKGEMDGMRSKLRAIQEEK